MMMRVVHAPLDPHAPRVNFNFNFNFDWLDIIDLILCTVVEAHPRVFKDLKGLRGTCRSSRASFDYHIKKLYIPALFHLPSSWSATSNVHHLTLAVEPNDRELALAHAFVHRISPALQSLDIDVGAAAELFIFPDNLRSSLRTLCLRSSETYGMMELLCDPSFPWLALETLHLHGHIVFSPMGREIFRSSGQLFPKVRRVYLSPRDWCSIIFPPLDHLEHVWINGFPSPDTTVYIDVHFEAPVPKSCVVEWDIMEGHCLLQINSKHTLPHIIMNVPRQTVYSPPLHFHVLYSTQLLSESNALHTVDIVSPGSTAHAMHPFGQHFFDCESLHVIT